MVIVWGRYLTFKFISFKLGKFTLQALFAPRRGRCDLYHSLGNRNKFFFLQKPMRALRFHPTRQVLMCAGENGVLSLFEVSALFPIYTSAKISGNSSKFFGF